MHDLARVRDVKRRHELSLLEIEGVHGVDIAPVVVNGEQASAIILLTTKDWVERVSAEAPKSLEDVLVVVRVKPRFVPHG